MPFRRYRRVIGEQLLKPLYLNEFSVALGRELPNLSGPRRHGDLAHVVADNTQIKENLGWQARSSLSTIVRSALAWEQKSHPASAHHSWQVSSDGTTAVANPGFVWNADATGQA